MMRHRTIFTVFCLLLASPAFAQKVPPKSAQAPNGIATAVVDGPLPVSVRAPGPRPVTKTEGRLILATISSVNPDSDNEGDCSHLVHDLYEQAGFPYDYASSRELYMGSTNFTRVRTAQPGDLIVWRGHVGIVIDPKERSFFSSTRSGPDTQFYDSPYWRSRGPARFYRYLIEKPLRSTKTIEAARRVEREPVPAAGRTSENRPPSKSSKSVSSRTSITAAATTGDDLDSDVSEAPGEIVLQVAGKNPVAEEVAAAFIEMNENSGDGFRVTGLHASRPVVVYREVRVSAVQIKGKHGTALARIESLGSLPNPQPVPQPRWRELRLEFEKTKKGWILSPVVEAAYVPREAALQALSARLAAIAQNADATPEQEREQKQIIHFLNLLVPEESSTASAQSH